MAAAVYTVHTSINPGVAYDVSAAEYEQLTDLGLVISLDAVTIPADQVVALPVAPAAPFVGQVWANNTIP